MLPGNGRVVANASGTGVHESAPYWGQGGGGGLIARAARCCWIVFARVGMTIRLAEAVVAKRSEAASATTEAHLCIRVERSPQLVLSWPRRLASARARNPHPRHAREGAQAARAARPREGRHLRLRTDGLRAHPRRERAAVRGLLAVQALPRARGLRRDARRQRHRRERQDLRGC